MVKKNADEMSFLDHLEDLRWLLVRSCGVIVIMGLVTYFFSDIIFDDIIFGPTNPNFITYRFFCELAHTLGITGDICVEEFGRGMNLRLVSCGSWYKWSMRSVLNSEERRLMPCTS